MKTYKFKTNINCGGCVSTIKPHLDQAEGVEDWDVNTNHKDKILTVHTTEHTREEKVRDIVSAAGFTADPLQKGLFGKLFGS